MPVDRDEQRRGASPPDHLDDIVTIARTVGRLQGLANPIGTPDHERRAPDIRNIGDDAMAALGRIVETLKDRREAGEEQ